MQDIDHNNVNRTLNNIIDATNGINSALLNEVNAFAGILSISSDNNVSIKENQLTLEEINKTLSNLLIARRSKIRSISAIKKSIKNEDFEILSKGCPDGLHGVSLFLK